MSGAQAAQGRRGAAYVFHLNDRIIQVVDITWPDADTGGNSTVDTLIDGKVVATSAFAIVS